MGNHFSAVWLSCTALCFYATCPDTDSFDPQFEFRKLIIEAGRRDTGNTAKNLMAMGMSFLASIASNSTIQTAKYAKVYMNFGLFALVEVKSAPTIFPENPVWIGALGCWWPLFTLDYNIDFRN